MDGYVTKTYKNQLFQPIERLKMIEIKSRIPMGSQWELDVAGCSWKLDRWRRPDLPSHGSTWRPVHRTMVDHGTSAIAMYMKQFSPAKWDVF
jgi:hypothetical protein